MGEMRLRVKGKGEDAAGGEEGKKKEGVHLLGLLPAANLGSLRGASLPHWLHWGLPLKLSLMEPLATAS